MKSRKAAWIIASTFPLWFVPLWLGLGKIIGANFTGLATATGGLLTVLVLTAAYTDSQKWRIPNWLTYVGTLWAFAINLAQSVFGNETSQQLLGAVGIGPSLLGFAVFFTGLLIVFSFSGGGAGDVKIGGAIGSFLGPKLGFEAILITYVGCAIVVVFQALAKLTLSGKADDAAGDQHETGGKLLGEEPSESINLLKTRIPLAPFFALGTIVILMRESGFFKFSIIGE